MRTGGITIAYGYVRLSREEARNGESNSITNQKSIIKSYCERHGIHLVRIFDDDGWSGGNFDRPGFQAMMRELENGRINTVITKDLSRLGRDMRESSYYAEEFFPENGIRYIAIADNFDTEHENIMAPFQFAMNEVYLRDGSRKVRDVLRNKRENGEYCACPPYGYKKDPSNRTRLIPDEETAPIVQLIFSLACKEESCRTIALQLNERGIIPPLKYRILYRDNFGERGAARATDSWNYTTVKRILKNKVYLGHTVLGKSRKPSVKSKKKVPVSEENWIVTPDTHEPLVSQETFDQAAFHLGRGTRKYEGFDHVRKSIFSGVAVCGLCGHSMCSCGTVYKGEREKYWYLSCNRSRKDIPHPCPGARIKYADLVEIIRKDLNSLIAMDDQEIDKLVQKLLKKRSEITAAKKIAAQIERAEARLNKIGKIIEKLYIDNADGRLSDERLDEMVYSFEKEAKGLQATIRELEMPLDDDSLNYERFFSLVKRYSHIDVLDRETLLTFVDKVIIGPKELPVGKTKVTHPNEQYYTQSIKIVYKFVGEMDIF